MKRILVTILCLLYMLSATGATVHIHYCMGKVMSAGFADHDENEPCGKCGMKQSTKKGCCKDVHKTVKAEDHQASATSINLLHTDVAVLPTTYNIVYAAAVNIALAGNITSAHAPLGLWQTCPIYIQVCNFRI